MFICLHQIEALFKMKFNEEYDFVHKFKGINDNNIYYNAPTDFTEAGITKNDDCWAIDIPFINATDEATPCRINDSYIGANHGHHGAVRVYSTSHGKTFKDIGSIWVDDKNVKFTLLRVYDENDLLFISENVGKNQNFYAFVTTISGKLAYLSDGENKDDITIEKQRTVDLTKVNRYHKKTVYGVTNGKREKVLPASSINGCDYGEIDEEYDIVNPSTIAPELTQKRPKNGYTENPNLALFGKPMVNVKNLYRIMPPATVVVDFTYKFLHEVKFEFIMGVMAQDKRNIFGGGTYRYMPKTLPITTDEGRFDFGSRIPVIDGPYPRRKFVTKEYWMDQNSPSERIVDYFKDTNGNDKLAFSIGFLPVFDGTPENRSKQANDTIMLYYSKKLYPTFASTFKDTYHGVGYKTYFDTQKNNASYYTVNYDGKTYLYADFFENNNLEIALNGKNALLLEKYGNTNYVVENDTLKITSDKGFASFVLE